MAPGLLTNPVDEDDEDGWVDEEDSPREGIITPGSSTGSPRRALLPSAPSGSRLIARRGRDDNSADEEETERPRKKQKESKGGEGRRKARR